PADPLHGRFHRPGIHRTHHPRTVEHGQPADHAVARYEDRTTVPVPADRARRTPVRHHGGRVAVPGPTWSHAEPCLPEFPPHRHPPRITNAPAGPTSRAGRPHHAHTASVPCHQDDGTAHRHRSRPGVGRERS